MAKIKLLSQNIHKHTLINNLFIDSYMPSANGDYVKVYIYLLRLILSNQNGFTTTSLAKQLNLIESDVIRALKYWDELRVLEIHMDGDTIKGIGMLSLERPEETIAEMDGSTEGDAAETASGLFTDSAGMNDQDSSSSDGNRSQEQSSAKRSASSSSSSRKAKMKKRPEYAPEELAKLQNQEEIQQLLYIAQRYIGKPLTQTDSNTIISFVEYYGLKEEVAEYLIEYCVSEGHTHMNYMEKVAMNWSEENITSIEQAKAYTINFNKNYYRVFKALGVHNRQPNKPQMDLIDKWIGEYNFAIEIIEHACELTIARINEPKLSYVEGILKNWHDNGAKSMKDIEKLDARYKKDREADRKKAKEQNTATPPKNSKNRFHNHDQRTYDYDILEKRMNDMLDKEINGK